LPVPRYGSFTSTVRELVYRGTFPFRRNITASSIAVELVLAWNS
jgi:hypothetical protein